MSAEAQLPEQSAARTYADPASVRLIGLDVDGVLTDGSIVLDHEGREVKRFNVRDGLGMKVWMGLGFHIAVVTRRAGGAVSHRMKELGVEHVVQGAGDKGEAMAEICQRLGVGLEESCFIGDDLPDLAAMMQVGYPVAVQDAEAAVQRAAAWVTGRSGGRGAVRELIDRLIEAKGLMEEVVGQYH